MKLNDILTNYEIRDNAPAEWVECWWWLGIIDATGRARAYVDGSRAGGADRAARLFFTHLVGPIPGKLHVLHKCHNKACVNPSHLYAGTNLDNIRDTDFAGLRRRPSTAKLTDGQVAVIRRSRVPGARLAALFNVNQSTVSRIRGRQTYKKCDTRLGTDVQPVADYTNRTKDDDK